MNKEISLIKQAIRILFGRVRWSSNLQNLRFEIDSTKEQVARLEKGLEKSESSDEISQKKKLVLKECWTYLDNAERAFQEFRPRELFVWQMLYLVKQKLLLVMPKSELSTVWHLLEKRIKKAKKEGNSCSFKKSFLKDVREKMNSRKQPDGVGENKDKDKGNSGLRKNLEYIRKTLDDIVILNLWQNMQIRRYTLAFVSLGILLLLSLILYFTFTYESSECACFGAYSVIGSTLAGSFGAVLSAVSPGKAYLITTNHKPSFRSFSGMGG
ncbi:MAG: hypothetical protein OXF20_09990, partial [Gammaproteobacteria bacterium]|nr:hypothetical protein [Gammaproteobacteria bacterium]